MFSIFNIVYCLFSCSNFAVYVETRFCRNIFLRGVAGCFFMILSREIVIDKRTLKTTPLLWPWRRLFAAAVIAGDE
jgi:hypothetical protein